MCKINSILVLLCILLAFGTAYGVRFEIVDSSFYGELSGYAGDQPLDDPCTPEREENVFSAESSSLSMEDITQNSSQTVWNARYAQAYLQIEGCGLRAYYSTWANTESYSDGSTNTKGRATIQLPISGGPNARFHVVLDDEPSSMPFIAHLTVEVSLYNNGDGNVSGLTGLNDEILVQLTRNGQTTTIYSYSTADWSDEGSFLDFCNLDITVYENDIISIYGGTKTNIMTATVGRTSSSADLYIDLELDPDECPADLAEDYRVDMEDFAVFAGYWLTDEGVPFPIDGVVDTPELMWMVDWWLWDNTVGCPVPDFAEPLVLNKEYRATTNGEQSHWYQFTPIASGQYSFGLLCSDMDSPVLNLYEPNGIESFNPLYSMEGDLLICDLVEDQPYYLEIIGYDGTTGTYILKAISGIIAPANDLCANRANIEMDYGSDWADGMAWGKTYGATGQDETPDCGADDVHDVWYTVTLPLAGDYYISLSGDDDTFMGTLSIFDGIGLCPGAMLDCAELTSTWGYIDILYNAQANETIIVRVASSDLASGKFGINLFLSGE